MLIIKLGLRFGVPQILKKAGILNLGFNSITGLFVAIVSGG